MYFAENSLSVLLVVTNGPVVIAKHLLRMVQHIIILLATLIVTQYL